ncbi:hypothetical protein [Streptomyces sp. NPDC002676]
MIATTPALLVQPDGQVDEIVLDSHRPDQLRCSMGAVERHYSRRLLLCTNGVYTPLGRQMGGVGGVLDLAADAKDAGTTLVADALAAAGPNELADNATALVVDLP